MAPAPAPTPPGPETAGAPPGDETATASTDVPSASDDGSVVPVDPEPFEPASDLDSPHPGQSDQTSNGAAFERAEPAPAWRLIVVGEVTGMAGFFVGALVGCFFGSGGNSLSGDACQVGLGIGAGLGATAAVTAGIYGAGTHRGAPGRLGYTALGTALGVVGAYGFHGLSAAIDAEPLAILGWLALPVGGGAAGFVLSRDGQSAPAVSAMAVPLAGGALMSVGGLF